MGRDHLEPSAAALVHLLTVGKVGKSNQNETKSLSEECGSWMRM